MQTTTTKAKPATKPATKATVNALVAFVSTYINKALTTKGETYYNTAIRYHAKRKTVFPRSDAYKALTKADAEMVFDRHAKGVLASGSGIGQAVFDLYMMHKK